jgi:hypothetical protein
VAVIPQPARSSDGTVLPRDPLRILWSTFVSSSLLGAAAWLLLDFPVARGALAVALAGCFVLLLKAPYGWLVILPAAMTALDLSPWTGRWLLTEFDLLVLVMLAALTWDRTPVPRSTRPLAPMHLIVLWTLAAWLASTLVGLDLDASFDRSDFAAQRGAYEGLRALKPVLYAALFIPAMRRAFALPGDAAGRLLAAGFCLGLVLLGLWVMWDRGVFTHLVHWRGPYALAEDLLNVSDSYRTTGQFAAMHTGGAAVDAYLLLALPFTLALLLDPGGAGRRLLALAGFGIGSYALLGTFSRATYVGFAIVVMVSFMIWFAGVRSENRRRGQLPVALAAFVSATALALGLYSAGGYQAMAGGTVGFAAGAFCVLVRERFGAAGAALATLALVGVVVAVAHGGITESKWRQIPGDAELLALLAGAAALPLLGWPFARALRGWTSPATLGAAVMAIALGWMLAVPAFSGYRMETRFAESGQDLQTRLRHWSDSAALRGEGVLGTLFGAGTGSYPRRYFERHLGETHVGSFRFVRDPGGSFLRLGVGDYNLMQRVPVEPGRRYRLVVRLRSGESRATVAFKLCHKNVLYSERHTPGCPVTTLSPEPGRGWQVLESRFEAGSLGRFGIAYWPVTLLVPHPNGGGTLDVTDVRLLDENGRNLIANGDFSRGADRWFFVSDYSHLPWHAKNLLLHLWVEQGWFGLAAFAALVLAVWARAWSGLRAGIVPAAVLATMPALATLSMVATIVDFPRVVLPLYLVLFAALYAPGGRSSAAVSGTA